jgi:transcriptional regulator with XRE-family HTH domain
MKRFSPERLVFRRDRKGLTQRELARRAGVSQVSISAYENGWKEPRAGTLARLSEALGRSTEYFFKS